MFSTFITYRSQPHNLVKIYVSIIWLIDVISRKKAIIFLVYFFNSKTICNSFFSKMTLLLII